MSAHDDLEERLSSLESSTRYELDSDEAMICKLLDDVSELQSQLYEIKSLLENA